ncbi:signal transduction histidine kinase [Elusimicrobium simillimum]|uniref:ATP-binding protein n=1 Tax=Elusimicrobium simillimum TaxID=3143438 RepID=UPI003C6F670E
MSRHQSKSLFTAIVKVLLITALVPVIVFGAYMFIIDSRMIKAELFDKQSFMNMTVENTVRSFFGKKRGLLRSFLNFHYVYAKHPGINRGDLQSMMGMYPQDINAIAFMDNKGVIRNAIGNLNLTTGRNGELNAIKYLSLNKGEDYIGVIKTESGGRHSIVISVPYMENKKVQGVLIARISLAEMVESLEDIFVEGMFYGIFTTDGNVIASSTPVTEDIVNALKSMNGKRSVEAKFSDGKKHLITTSVISATGWIVYVQQPSQTWTRIISKNSESVYIVLGMIVGVIIFVLLLSKVAIKPIVQPMKLLEDAAAALSKGQYDYLPKIDKIPDNEVGDLFSAFIKMSQSLKEQREDILKAEKNLSDTNAILERKVEERTRALGRATDALVKKERLAAIGELASIISHEIRNPLAVISNSSKLIKAIVGEENPKLQKQFNIIDSEVRQANRIVEEVLGYARDRKQILTEVDLNTYVKELIATQPVPENIKVETLLDEQSAVIKIDAEEMKQALRNLIGNAVEVMPSGGTLNIGTKVGKKVVCICISDEGVGMGEDTLLKIFTPFFTTKARGTGLGLAVVKKAVGNNKGKMFVESEKGSGTKFKIYLRR